MAIDGAEYAAAASSEVFETSELCHEGAIERRFNARDDAENESIARIFLANERRSGKKILKKCAISTINVLQIPAIVVQI